MNKNISFAGSGELDNGWTVSISQTLNAGNTTGVGLTIDMGDMGSLNYELTQELEVLVKLMT